MKIALDESVELEFNQWTLEQAAESIEEIRHKHRERADDVLRATLTLLLFGQIESNNPGTIKRLFDESGKVAKSLQGTKPTDED